MKLFLDVSTFIDTSEPIDLSIPLSDTEDNPKAWYVEKPTFEPVRTVNYIGSVLEGGNVNFRNVFFNPHGHGTHTECLGHITEQVHSINKTLNTFFFQAKVITIVPSERKNKDGNNDFVILASQIKDVIEKCEALIIRTSPNSIEKKSKNYSATNPPYFDVDCVALLLENGIKHLLIDLPSVDRENDNGELVFHHAFWEVPKKPNFERTITEMIYVDDSIEDGEYILNLQVAPFENDASPSRPVLYKQKKS
tara:strand:+ start:3139 stop:3891 length:753 start_codon:yes stop_codon:yes gene_type:complete